MLALLIWARPGRVTQGTANLKNRLPAEEPMGGARQPVVWAGPLGDHYLPCSPRTGPL